MVDFGFDEGFCAGDGDAVLADELGGGDIVRAEFFCDQRHGARNALVGRLDGRAPNVDLAVMIYRHVMPVKAPLLRYPFEPDPISM